MSEVIIADINSKNNNGDAVGHYFTVAQNYVDMFPGNVRVAGGPLFLTKFKNAINLGYDNIVGAPVWKNKLNILKNIRQLLKNYGDKTIVFQSSAIATIYFALIFHKRKKGKIYIIQYNTHSITGAIKKLLYRFAKNKIDGFICTSDAVGKAYGKPYCVIPDYVYTGSRQPQMIDYDKKKYDFGLPGIICRDKGTVEAAKFFAGTEYKVIIAGKPSDTDIENELKKICSNAPNITLKLGYLSEEEYNDLIENSRSCVLNYSGAYSEHTSGVVFDILFGGVPVAGRRCRSLEFIEQNGIGTIFDDISSFKPEIILNKEENAKCIDNIFKYYELHKDHIKRLGEFLSI